MQTLRFFSSDLSKAYLVQDPAVPVRDNIIKRNMRVLEEVVCQWPPVRTNFPKRNSILSNHERRNILLCSRLDKMLTLFGKLAPKGGYWQTTSLYPHIFPLIFV